MTETGAHWVDAPDASLDFLDQVATGSDIAGHQIRPLPDKVFVLHPIFERVDGGSVQDRDDDHELRPLRWRDYAERRGVPLVREGGYPAIRDALPGVWRDDHVRPPGEGDIEDDITRTAICHTLIDHTVRGADESCTAWWYGFWIDREFDAPDRINVMRGPLGAWAELYDRNDRSLGPQTFWPDDHSWVLSTHTDSWATAVSGSTALIDALITNPNLEAVRMPWLD